MTADQQALNHIAGTEQTVEELLLVRVPSMMSSCFWGSNVEIRRTSD